MIFFPAVGKTTEGTHTAQRKRGSRYPVEASLSTHQVEEEPRVKDRIQNIFTQGRAVRKDPNIMMRPIHGSERDP